MHLETEEPPGWATVRGQEQSRRESGFGGPGWALVTAWQEQYGSLGELPQWLKQ